MSDVVFGIFCSLASLSRTLCVSDILCFGSLMLWTFYVRVLFSWIACVGYCCLHSLCVGYFVFGSFFIRVFVFRIVCVSDMIFGYSLSGYFVFG